MKLFKILALFLAVSLVLGMALPAYAKSTVTTTQPVLSFQVDKGKGGKPEAKVKVVRGEVKDIIGNVIKIDDKEVLVTDETKYKVPGLGKEATLADIKKGTQVVALVYQKDDELHARQIVVIPGKPVTRHHVGKVTAYSYDATTGGSITIETKSGDKFTFEIIAGKFKILPRAAEVKVGDRVTVISHRDPAQDRLIADGVVVYQPTPIPSLEPLSGAIANIDATAKTLTIGDKVLHYNEATLFVLRGTLAVTTGQNALVFYVKKDDTLLARSVLIGIDLPQVMKELGESEKE